MIQEQKLFAVYLGGNADGCSIEVHDVVFVIGTTIEETYPILVKKWFGNPNKCHIDSYMELQNIEGYQIGLSQKPPSSDIRMKLYFINFGAYKPGEFTEYHQNAFYVAESPAEAIKKARKELCLGLDTIHKDDLVQVDHVDNSIEYEVDDVLEVKHVDGYYIVLTPNAATKQEKPTSAYIRLDQLPLRKS